MPVPSAEMIACTSVLASTLSIRAFSTLRILPRIGRIACTRGSRPWRAEPRGGPPRAGAPPRRPPLHDEALAPRGFGRRAAAGFPGRPPPTGGPLRGGG